MQLHCNGSIATHHTCREHCLLEQNALTFTNSKHNNVPQGLIFRHLFFMIYINDIINSSNILSFVLFTDDTAVCVQHDSIDGEIQILYSELAEVAE